MSLDVVSNRLAIKWTRKELFYRALWEYFGAPIFSFIPRPLWAVRGALLRIFGAQIGTGVHIFPSVRIAVPWNLKISDRSAIGDRVIIYNLGLITIGEAVTISHGAHLCAGTHDYSRPEFPLIKTTIEVRSGAWICADAFIGPGIVIGTNSIVGARSVVMKNVEESLIVIGNPAREIKKRLIS